ncbi:MAG: hypothetical protein NG712_04935, partial [Omnitrophica bacterium]|nr:hypothetical protein [Candidatus Omnitrophota bacterium]
MLGTLKYKIGICCTIIILIIAVYPAQSQASPKPLQVRLEDGVILKVHLPEGLKGIEDAYASQALEAASTAYREIVFNQGFNRVGYTFAQSDNLFAYDSDKTIDIYIANVKSPFAVLTPQGGLEYKAKIFIPADYRSYRKKYNIEHPELELKASFAHELLHIITFSYNRNMQGGFHGKTSFTSHRWDWYTEGLARYFETLVGYKQEFFSAGFREQRGRIIQVYKAGANYFLNYPDEPLSQRKYDFALFWQYLHKNFGMEKIEEISVKFRQIDPQTYSNQEAMQLVAQTLNVPLDNLLRNFSLYLYKISSLSTEAENELNPVSISKLTEQQRKTSSISSFGYDFYEIDLDQEVKSVWLKSLNGRKNLNCLVRVHSPFGFSSCIVRASRVLHIKL